MTAYKDIEKRKVYQKLWAREKSLKKKAMIFEPIVEPIIEIIVESVVESIAEAPILETTVETAEEIVETAEEIVETAEEIVEIAEEIVETAEKIVEMIATPVVEIANKIIVIPPIKIYDGYSLLYLENERLGLSQTPPAIIWKRRVQSDIKGGWSEPIVSKPERKIIRQFINGVFTGKCFYLKEPSTLQSQQI
jgi:HEPN domain-containing protein